jgi:hypothetical protein
MRNLSALVAALSLGACAAQPPALADLAAQIRSDFGAVKQSCEDQSPTGPGQNAAHVKCFNGNPVAQLKPNVQMAETQTRTKQRIVIDQPERAPQPKLASANETVVESIPTLNSEANCHLPDNLVAVYWLRTVRAMNLLTVGSSSPALTAHTAPDIRPRAAAGPILACSLASKWRCMSEICR